MYTSTLAVAHVLRRGRITALQSCVDQRKRRTSRDNYLDSERVQGNSKVRVVTG